MEEMRVFWRVLEAVGIEMVVVLRVVEQVELGKWVIMELELGIRLVVVEEVRFKLVVLVVEE